MSIENRFQLENTQKKLQELEQLYAKTLQGSGPSEHVREQRYAPSKSGLINSKKKLFDSRQAFKLADLSCRLSALGSRLSARKELSAL